MLRNTAIFILLVLAPLRALSTHIVGGVLNYAYNGNNVYTITLKLFRDCGSGTASFPGSITIQVKGNNGAGFSPSKNLTINLGAVTTVTAPIDPCGIPPNPMPCVQQGVYTKTISLPPNTGGYHLYYSLVARNLSLTNINASCNCIGESFYAYIPDNTSSANNNSNPVFSSFPPLFLCVNQGFSINHSATDLDGDSLVYSLYTPYNSNNPTFTNNVAYFTPVTYVSGFTYTTPLGASPFTINPVTGIITGTPGLTGQFVVGVRVREYRNGNYVSETIRDFQFNVLNCPAPPPQLAVGNQTINNGCSKVVVAQGIAVNSATWTSIFPGTIGAYNGYMSCTSNCLTNTIVATGTPPSFVDFRVCGTATTCLGGTVCDTFRVHFQPPLSVSIAPTNPALCNGQTSTTLMAVGSGGTPPYAYLWNNVNPSQVITVGVGTYNVRLSDVSGCPPVYASAVVTSYSVPVSINAVPNLTRCVTNPLAPLGATVTGASGVLWSGGSGTFSPNNTSASNVFYTPSSAELAAGAATLVVSTTGSGFCPAATDTVVITYSNFTGTVITTPTMVSCFGLSNASVAISVAGGLGPHSYTWQVSPVQTGTLLTNKPAGTYSFTINDNIGCTRQGSVVITQPAILGLSFSVTNVTCFGSSNGSASVSASGGTAPYTFSWMPVSQTGSVATGLAAGTFSARVTDSKGCNTTSLVSITQPATLVIASTQTNVACNSASTGVITSTVTGGTTPYSYSWTPGGATAPGLSNLPAGTYTLKVIDQNNCQASRTITITQPASLAVVMSATNETCEYLNNGRASVNVSGGTPGYTYTWTPGGANTSTAGSLAAGNYTVSVMDANNCAASGTVSVTQPPVLSVSLLNYSPVRCFGASNGSVTALGNGGVAGYTYLWSPSGITSASLTNRPAGTFTVTVTDANTCTASAVQVITQPAQLVQAAVINTVSCSGGSNAAVSLSVTGGTGAYSYLWLPGAQTGATLSPATAGSYTAIVTDANNCTVSATYSVSEPLPINISLTQIPVSCFGGTNGAVTSTVTGGHAPYTFSWSPGATTQSLSGVGAGTYSVTVTDNLSCTASKTVTVTQPTQLAVSVSFTNESCDYANNGSATAAGSGGTAPYTYTWQPGAISAPTATGLASGTYSVFVSDANLCLTFSQVTIQEPAALVPVLTSSAVSCFGGSNGQAFVTGMGGTPNYQYTFAPTGSTLSSASNLSAGVVTVTISDSKGCVAQGTVVVSQPPALSATEVITNVSCFNGNNASVAVSAAGGTSPYAYFWSPGGLTTSSVSGLAAGSHTVFITDANNCSFSKVYVITQPPALVISNTVSPVSCFAGADGSISAMASGGTAPYTYSWTHGPVTTTVNGLAAGVYSITVSDSFSCSLSQTITVNQPTQFVLATSFTNETCDYLDNGAASVSGGGGTAPYTYTWMPGASSTSMVASLPASTYTILASDANGCPAQATVTVSQPAPLAVTFTQVTNATCAGYNDGSAQSVVTGGTANYSYTWTSGAISSALNGSLNAGTHTLTVSDQNGCTASGTVSITEPLPLSISAITSLVQCAGGTNGGISLSINGGTPPYANLIMPGNITGSNFSNLSAGNYTIYSTDSQGCVSSGTVQLNEALALSTVVSHTSPSCGLTNGVASISVTSGGQAPFTYSWMPVGGTASVASNLGPGSYTIRVTDSQSCTTEKILDLSNSSAPVVVFGIVTNVSCFGGSDASITASVTGGTAPFTFSWSPIGGTTNVASNLPKGYYSLAVTDDVGCVGVITSSLIDEPAPITIALTTSAVSCNGGNNGAASALVVGGTPGYTYTWQSGAASGNSVTGLSAGNYSILVTDTKLCTQTGTFAISEPSLLNLSVSSTSVTCSGGLDGAASGTASGGTSPYSYSWTPVNVGSQQLSNVAAGIYTLTARDAKACTAATTVEVIEPAPLALALASQNSDCSLANGQATVSASGGMGGYTYTWSSGATGSVAASLLSGTHSVSVGDMNFCQASATVAVNDNPAPVVAITSVSSVACFNGATGAAQATVTGGTGPFSFSWSPGGGNSATASGLAAGQYTLLVVSANNCSVTAVSPVITQPAPLILSVSTTSVPCFGGNNGSATVTAFGGTGAYSYTWQAGVPSGSTASGFANGSYTVLARDANDCPAVASFSIAQPFVQLSASIATQSVLCNGGSNGSATVTPSGGTSPYNYLWSPGSVSSNMLFGMAAGNYSVDITDFNGCSLQQTVAITEPSSLTLTPSSMPSNCSAANGQASVTATGGTTPYSYQWSPSGGTASVAVSLAAGAYSVTVTDGNNCIAVAGTTVNDLPAATVSISSVGNVSCFGGASGTATAVVNGGTGPFNFQWSAGVGTASTVSGLPAGQHTVTVTSANGCSVSAVTPVITQPQAIVISFNVLSSVNCFGGSNGALLANVFGGTSPYSYSWSPVPGSSGTLSGLPAGTYSLLVTDNNSCTASGAISITEPAMALNLSVNATSVFCNGNATGSATVLATGGTAPYSYNWSPAASTASVAGGLPAGDYTVQSIDSKGCAASATVNVAQPSQALTLAMAIFDAPCFGTSGGNATVTASGGTPNYTYSWSAGAGTSSVLSGVAAGTYTTLVTDQNLCTASTSFIIGEPALLTGTILGTDPSCGRSNGLLNAQVSGGTGPFAYLWNPSNTNSSTISGLAPGNYGLVVSDANSCTVALTATLTNIPGPVVTVTSIRHVSCFGLSDGASTITATSGTPPFVIQWLPTGGNTLTAQQLSAGVYTAAVTDLLGCVTTVTADITQPDQLNIGVDSLRNVSCFGQNDGAIFVSGFGGTSPYTYTWSTGSSTNAATSLTVGTYTVQVADVNNCSFSITASISQPPALTASAAITRSILCFGGFGDASVTIAGGTAPYSISWNSAPPQNGNVLNAVPAGSYTASVTDNNGCTISDDVTFIQPSQIATAVSQLDTVCANSSSLLVATAAGGVGSYLYTWAPDGSVTTGTLQFSVGNDVTYTVVAFDKNGCAGSDAVSTINVYNLLDGNVQLLGYTPICPGQASSLEAKVGGYPGPVTYKWSHNIPANPGPHVVQPKSRTIYSLTVTNACGQVVKKTTTVEIASPPEVHMIADSLSVCAPGSIQFREVGAAINSADPVVEWFWDFGNGEISGEQEPDFYFPEPGTYTVHLTVTSGRGCVNTSSVPLQAKVHPKPVADFTLSSTTLQLPFDELKCTNLSVGATNFRWDFGDGKTSTLVNPSVRLEKVGTTVIQLIAISQFGCMDTAVKIINTYSDIRFPNAFTPDEAGSSGGQYDVTSLTNNVFFPYTSGVTDYSLQVFNRWGELIFESTDLKIGWDGYYRGVLCQQGVYVWKASAKLGDGKNFSQAGTVTLLRKGEQ